MRNSNLATASRAMISLLVTCLLALACGSDAPPPPAAADAANESSSSITPQRTDEATAPAEETAVASDSPLEQLLGVPVFDEDAMNGWFRELDIERQRLTAECMLAEGFEYTPETSPAASRTDHAITSREYAATHGFGIGLAFNDASYDPAKDYSTPNSRYLASLSAGEADAYHLALRGVAQDDGPDQDEGGMGLPTSGCEGRAFAEVFSVINVLDQFTPAVDGYYEQFIADSRMIALTTEWQQCMSEAGYLFADAEEMRESFFIALNQITHDGSFKNTELPDDLPEPPLVFSGDVYSFHPELTEAAQEEFDELIALEVATAVAHFDCREPLIEQERAIQREYEAQIVAEIGPTMEEALGGS